MHIANSYLVAAVGYPHTDSMYFHQRGQINFWVPLTKVYDSNTLWVESSPGLQVPVHHDISREEQGRERERCIYGWGVCANNSHPHASVCP